MDVHEWVPLWVYLSVTMTCLCASLNYRSGFVWVCGCCVIASHMSWGVWDVWVARVTLASSLLHLLLLHPTHAMAFLGAFLCRHEHVYLWVCGVVCLRLLVKSNHTKTLPFYLFSQCLFFAMGNSHSMSTVDNLPGVRCAILVQPPCGGWVNWHGHLLRLIVGHCLEFRGGNIQGTLVLHLFLAPVCHVLGVGVYEDALVCVVSVCTQVGY